MTCLFGAGFFYDRVEASELGRTVTNVASLSTPQPGGGTLTVNTNPAIFIIEAQRTQSTIEFFRYAPAAPEATLNQINGADFSPSGDLAGPFLPVDMAGTSGGPIIDMSSAIPLSPALTYVSGELLFVRVIDLGQNGDPATIETVSITVATSGSDLVTLRLYESGPDTGEFWAYIPSSFAASPINDTVLTAGQGTQLTATYIDSFDATEISLDTALVDPYGRVFNALTGDYIDNARVTLINAATGQPAQVFGVDGVSSYPSSMLSGQNTTDASGLVYQMRPGEFRFPLAAQGDYYVLVDPPQGLSFASTLAPADFVGLANAPFVIDNNASYGLIFTLGNTGPLNFDIPLDAQSKFALLKSVDRSTGDVGDFVTYTVSIENNGGAGAPVTLHDTIPQGFSFVKGSAHLAGAQISDPQQSATGQELTFSLGALSANAKLKLQYVLKIGPNVKHGEAVNEIIARDNNNVAVSNISRARLTIREDLFRSHSTIIGRISEDACDGDEDWAREIEKGVGVAGVRLYMETGAYAISDKDGLFHFEGVKTGTHVVQLDEETLPRGYEPMVCEETSRYAGKATSKFVEVKGGGLWRANFYLKRNAGFVEDTTETVFNDQTEYKAYNRTWLATQTPELEWVYPAVERTPSTPSINVGIKHGASQRVKLTLNGKPVPHENYSTRDIDRLSGAMLTRLRGVDLLEGENKFIVVVNDLEGNQVRRLAREIHFVRTIARATVLPDQSILVADGRTKPVLAIRLEDEAGRAVHAGRIIDIQIPAPYHLYQEDRLGEGLELTAPDAARTNITVGQDGIARVALAPTLKTGKATIHITLDNGRSVTRYLQLTPEKRDWIIVGLAEGSAALNSLNNKIVAIDNGAQNGLQSDGRVAFFAKGLVRGDWLMTLAVDTDKRRGKRDGDFASEIDPNAYYTLYGDESYSDIEAVSRYPFYLKLEKKSFYAMFGDYSTNITEGKLTKYNRHLSGFKAEHLGENFQALGYLAETNQGFTKDEFAADGTSGPYHLSNDLVLANSETITIETRDRFRPDQIIETRHLVRHLDYTLDNYTGEIIFRLPVDLTDSGLNPKVIMVDYETAADSERNLSFGGRVQRQLVDGKVQIGSTFVHEGGNGNNADARADMIGAEIIAQLTKGTELRTEYALTTKTDAATPTKTANAYLAEIIHTSDKFSADAYIRQEEAGFGLKQRSSATRDIRRYGANATYTYEKFEDATSGRRGSKSISGSFSRQENLGTGSSREQAEVKVERDSDIARLSGGVRHVKDNIAEDLNRESLLAFTSARRAFPKWGTTLQVTHELPLSGKGGVSDHPQRTRFGLDQRMTKKASLHLTHDILDGANAAGSKTAIGISYQPWTGADMTLGTDAITSDSARRVGATVGLDQQVLLNDRWSLSAGVSTRRVLRESGTIEQITPDAAVSPIELNETYSAGYIGTGYRTEKTTLSSRVERRIGKKSESLVTSVSGSREASEKLSFAGAVRARWHERSALDPIADGQQAGSGTVADASIGESHRLDGRLGASWRPRDEDLVLVNRLDLVVNNQVTGTNITKVVNNFAANDQVSDRLQVSANYGVKYVKTQLSDQTLDGISQLIGGEARYDLTERVDISFHASTLISEGQQSYSYGPSLGVSPVDNVWLSVGYNVEGYADEDFAAAEYAQKGAYVALRVKFDQTTARGLLKKISPSGK